MIAFKEKDGGGQYFKDERGEWLKTSENHIMSLWNIWVISPRAMRYTDDEGYLVFDFKEEETVETK